MVSNSINRMQWNQCCRDCRDGRDGRPGRDGRDGLSGGPGPRGDPGPQGPPGKDSKCDKDCTISYPVSSAEYSYSVDNQGVLDPAKAPNIETYVNLTITAPAYPFIVPTNPQGVYGCWCIDPYDEIYSGQPYQGRIVRLLDPSSADLYMQYYRCSPNMPNLSHLRAVAYIIDRAQAYSNPPYSFSVMDIQSAIWTTLFSDYPIHAELITRGRLGRAYNDIVTPSQVRYIIAEALQSLTSECYCAKNEVLMVLTNAANCMQILAFSIPIY